MPFIKNFMNVEKIMDDQKNDLVDIREIENLVNNNLRGSVSITQATGL